MDITTKKIKKLSKRQIIYTTVFSVIFVLCLTLTITLRLSWLSFISAIFGILYIAFLSEKSVYNFFIGLVSTLTYVVITYRVGLYGEAIFYLLFDLPMILISFLFWKKHLTGSKVKPRTMPNKYKIILFLSTIILIFLYSLFLNLIGGKFVLLDATSSLTTIIATVLMAFRFQEQWVMWIAVYVISVILWIVVFDVLMLIMSTCCLVSCVVGYFNWKKKKSMQVDNA